MRDIVSPLFLLPKIKVKNKFIVSLSSTWYMKGIVFCFALYKTFPSVP